MENRNTIIALVLMFVVWFGYNALFPPQTPEAVPETVQEQVAAKPEDPKGTPPPAPSKESISVQEGTGTEQVVDDRLLTIETDAYEAIFTNRGGRLLTFRLKNFQESEHPQSPLVSLIDSDPRFGSLRLAGTEGFGLQADLPYSVSVDEEVMRLSGAQEKKVVFRAVTSGGLIVEKIFTFSGSDYDFDLEVRLSNSGGDEKSGRLVLSLVQPWDESMKGTQFEFVGPVTLSGEDVVTDDVEDVAEEGPISYGNAVWTAFETKYFISAAVPLEAAAEKIQVEKQGEAVLNQLETPYRTLVPGETVSFNYLLYFGPRDLEILKEVNYRLEEAIDFGFFSLLALPLRHVLTFFYGFVGNYGIAIILLTVVIKLLFWPLTHKSYASMKAMQKLQPEMQKIREKFKNDRERMNRELMEMYKTHRVNPLGGCLPMLVQIPVFFALYKVLLGDIALRHAPFMLWITDLSAKDPYYITPIVMGGTMFLQQKMTPTTMDPTQAKMFMIMPVVFTFLFLNFPAGLVIYWLTNNILTIAQQMLINRKA